MKRKILINATAVKHKYQTGIARYTLKVVDELIYYNEDLSLTVICFKDVLEERQGVNYIYVKETYRNNFLHMFWNSFIYTFYLKNYDLGYSPASYGSYFSKKQIITIHDLICFKDKKKYFFQYLYLYLSCYVWLKVLKINIIAISKITRVDIINHFNVDKKKLSLVYNGLTKIEHKIVKTSKGKYFLVIGGQFPHKNIGFILDAYSKLPNHIVENYKLIIVSKESDYLNKIKKMSLKMKLENNLVFKGYVSDKELSYLYSNASLFLTASSVEGFGFTLYEALSRGCDVLASDIAVFNEVYGSTINYFKLGDVNDFNNKVISILENSSSEECLKKANFLSEKYSWKSTSLKLINLFNKYH